MKATRPATNSWSSHKQKLLEDPEFRKEYDKLDLEYQVASALIGARIERGMTQQDLAVALGTKQSVISRAEGMNALPSLSFLRRIADTLGYTVELHFKPKPRTKLPD
jgi:ribosome-binding protein aMBF1 (putative translation factor)